MSMQLVRSGVRLSKHLATSLGNPRQGSFIFLNAISVGHMKGDTAIPRLKAEITECAHLTLQWCPPLENTLLPSLPPPSPVFKTPTSSSKRKARTGASPKDQFRSSPSPSPISKMDARRLESSPGFSSQEEPRFVTQNMGNVAAVRSLFEADMSKGMSLVQLFAERWLCGRYLMPGSLVSLPICGCDCLFMVETLSETHEDSHVEDSSLPIYKVFEICAFSFLSLLAIILDLGFFWGEEWLYATYFCFYMFLTTRLPIRRRLRSLGLQVRSLIHKWRSSLWLWWRARTPQGRLWRK
jgi:hypothetical protein